MRILIAMEIMAALVLGLTIGILTSTLLTVSNIKKVAVNEYVMNENKKDIAAIKETIIKNGMTLAKPETEVTE